MGEITRVLDHLVLKEVFDRGLNKRFPGIAYERYISEVFIASKEDDKVTFNENALNDLFKELNLYGDIVSIGVGDDPLECYSKTWMFLDNNSNVRRLEIHGI